VNACVVAPTLDQLDERGKVRARVRAAQLRFSPAAPSDIRVRQLGAASRS